MTKDWYPQYRNQLKFKKHVESSRTVKEHEQIIHRIQKVLLIFARISKDLEKSISLLLGM